MELLQALMFQCLYIINNRLLCGARVLLMKEVRFESITVVWLNDNGPTETRDYVAEKILAFIVQESSIHQLRV